MKRTTRTTTVLQRPAAILTALLVFVTLPVFAEGAGESTGTPGSAEASPALVKASIDYLEGDVSVDGSPAEIGMELEPGAVVVVGEDSLGEVAFGANIVRIYADTTAVIDIGQITSQVTVNRGAVAAVLDGLQELGNDGGMQIRTPTAVGGVRGTSLYVRVEDVDRTFFCVCNGSVHLHSPDENDGQLVSAAHHSGLRFIRADDGSISTEIPEMAYHDDAEMNSLAARINAQIDWSSVQ